MIAGGEDYEPKTRLGSRFVDWRRRRKNGKLFDEQPYFEEENEGTALSAPKNMNVLSSAGI